MTSMLDLSNVKYDHQFKVYFTYDDISNLAEYPEGPMIELYNGELFMTPSPTPKHQRISKNMTYLLEGFLRKNKVGSLFTAPIDVVLSTKDVVIPDLVIVLNNNRHIISEKNIAGAPTFVIEILSSNRSSDLVKKKEIYEKYKVEEYWIVDPDNEIVIQYLLKDNKFEENGKFGRDDDVITSESIDCSISVDEIFG